MEQAQRIAARVVRGVLKGSALPAVLAQASARIASADRALIQELAYGTLRFLGQLRAIVRFTADKPLADESIEALLWVALYQLIHTRAPAHAVVDHAVRATARLKRTSAQRLVNAILRNFLRRRESLLAVVARDPEARFSYPRWWIERVCGEYRERGAAILDAGNVRPPLTLRVNRRRCARDDYLATLIAQGIAATAVGGTGVVVAQPRPAGELPGYGEGLFSVQDAGAQLAAVWLAVEDGMRVLDACAAPGGKTTHLAELADLDLVALDADALRLQRVAENLARLGLQARLIAADAAETAAWWDGVGYDRVLADVPCSASGIVRRHPDAKWLRRESDVASFVDQQRRLLDGLWSCLARHGLLLYVTCSIFRDENESQVSDFIGRHADAQRVPLAAPAELEAFGNPLGVQLLPAGGDAAHNHDGFFYALLQKT